MTTISGDAFIKATAGMTQTNIAGTRITRNGTGMIGKTREIIAARLDTNGMITKRAAMMTSIKNGVSLFPIAMRGHLLWSDPEFSLKIEPLHMLIGH
jgi:hypothetical protein